jgi:hypothetical protein
MSTLTLMPAAGPRASINLAVFNRRLAGGLLVSLLLHAVLLSLHFGIPGLRPGSGSPLSVVLAPAGPTSPSVVAPVAELPAPVKRAMPLPSAAVTPSVPVTPPPAQEAPMARAEQPAPAPHRGFTLGDPAPALPAPPTPRPAPPVRRALRRRTRPRPMTPQETLHTKVITRQAAEDPGFVLPQPDTPATPEAPQLAQQADEEDAAALATEQEAVRARADAEARQREAEEVRRLAEQQQAEQRRADALARQELAEKERTQQLAAQQRADELARQRLAEQQRAQQLLEQRQAEESTRRQLAEQERAQQIAEQQRSQQLAEQRRTEELARQRLVEQQRTQQLAEQLRAEELARRQLAEQQRAQQLAEQGRAEELARQQVAEQQRARQLADQREAEDRARQAARQRADELARQQAEEAGRRLAGQGDGPGQAAAAPGGNFGSRARELLRGIDIAKAVPPAIRAAEQAQQAARRALADAARRDVPLRMYIDSVRQKIERNAIVGQIQLASQTVHTDPVVSIAIRSDGSIEDVTILRSSGRPDIDEIVRRIVRLNARYAAFPANVAANYDVIELRRIWTFAGVLRLVEEVR